jgi:hypothetical protein
MLIISLLSFKNDSILKNRKELKSELIGEWIFNKITDDKGSKIDTIWHGQGFELANGPILNYYLDSTYTKQFNPEKIDRGTWIYDNKKKEILHDLIYNKPYNSAANYLIEIGHAKKNKNGDYYEVITNKVLSLSDDKLILERRGNQYVYLKKK